MHVAMSSKLCFVHEKISFALCVYTPKWKVEKFVTCHARFKSCNSSNGNWLITQYIYKKANITYAIELTVKIYAQMSVECVQSCKYGLHIYYYPSNGPVASGAQLNTANYIHAATMSGFKFPRYKSVTFYLGSQFDRFYIAIVAERVCIAKDHIQVSYRYCTKKKAGLVVYPRTPIGANAVNTSASCKANAVVSPNTSLSVVCNTNGKFSGSPQCLCEGGYFSTGKTCYGENSEHAVALCTFVLKSVHSKLLSFSDSTVLR